MFGVDGAEDESVAVLKPVIPPDAEDGPCLRARVVRAYPGGCFAPSRPVLLGVVIYKTS